jgi:hypothetical protein
MEKDPLQDHLREGRRRRKLGGDAECLRCGQTNPYVLRRVGKSILERHHITGRAYGEQPTVVLCLNCHRIFTEKQRQEGIDLRSGEPKNVLEVLKAILQSVASFCEELAAWFRDWAAKLAGFIEALDANCPNWRTLPGATI